MADTFVEKFNMAFFKPFTALVQSEYSEFNADKFLELIFNEQWDEKQFKQRIRHISDALHMTLPERYNDAIDVLKRIAPHCTGIEYLFFPDFVEAYGLDHWEASIVALEHFTAYSSSEFAVRPFIAKDTEKMMAQMLQWSTHSDHHVRRLASEGCRPRLPWAMALNPFKIDPSPILPILERLKNDPSEYVRKSVANNLNDIAKDHPELVKQLAKNWHGDNTGTNWIIKHGCRGLLRKADPDVLSLFGFTVSPDVTVSQLILDQKTLAIGGDLTFSFSIQSNASGTQRIRVEYGIDFVKANGIASRKLFKITENNYDQSERSFVRTHRFKDLTTRKHYAGKHRLSIVLNGIELAEGYFDVTSQ